MRYEPHRHRYAHVGTTLADGKCSVQVFLIAPAAVAHASSNEIRHAGQAVYNKCVAHTHSRGGIASRIGKSLYIS